MKIQSRHPSPHDSSKICIVLDDLRTIDVSVRTWSDLDLKVGQVLSDELLSRLFDASAFDRALQLSYRYLKGKPRTLMEMKRYLTRKGEDPEVTARATAYLEGRGLLNDADYAESYVKRSVSTKSRRDIEFRMQNKGIRLSNVVSLDVLNELDSAEMKTAKQLAIKYCRIHQGEDPRAVRNKLGAYLQRRGFRMSSIRLAIESAISESAVDSNMPLDDDDF